MIHTREYFDSHALPADCRFDGSPAAREAKTQADALGEAACAGYDSVSDTQGDHGFRVLKEREEYSWGYFAAFGCWNP